MYSVPALNATQANLLHHAPYFDAFRRMAENCQSPHRTSMGLPSWFGQSIVHLCITYLPPSERVVADVLKHWWSTFGSGGERCSEEVVRKCHLRWLQMPSAMVANAICDVCKWHLSTTCAEQRQPPFPNNGNHHISTTATTLSEQRIWTRDK